MFTLIKGQWDKNSCGISIGKIETLRTPQFVEGLKTQANGFEPFEQPAAVVFLPHDLPEYIDEEVPFPFEMAIPDSLGIEIEYNLPQVARDLIGAALMGAVFQAVQNHVIYAVSR